MCDNCRANVQFEDGAFNQGTPRPTVRTTEDYLREREERRARGEPDDVD